MNQSNSIVLPTCFTYFIIFFFVCFLSNELIENETEFEEDTLDLVREDEMKVKLLTIYFNQL